MNCELCGISFKIMSVYKKHLQTENHKIQRQMQDNFYTYIHYKSIHQKKWHKLNTNNQKSPKWPNLKNQVYNCIKILMRDIKKINTKFR